MKSLLHKAFIECYHFPAFDGYAIWLDMASNIKKMTTFLLLIAGLICFWLFFKSIDFFEKYKTMTALFILAILVFVYICYVLVKPEKF